MWHSYLTPVIAALVTDFQSLTTPMLGGDWIDGYWIALHFSIQGKKK